jgi:hypothetical protein
MGKRRHISLILWRILKILGITIAVILFLFGIFTWIVFEKKNDWLAMQIQSYMDQSQSGQLEIASIELKLFRNFPNITIELAGINYYEHRDSIRTQNEKPILHAEKLFVAVELIPLFKNELKVSEVSLSNAQLNIVEYQNGKLNINLALAYPKKTIAVRKKVTTSIPTTPPAKSVKPKPTVAVRTKSALQVDLNLISLNDILITWKTYAVQNPAIILINELQTDFVKDGKVVNVKLTSVNHVQSLYVNNISLPSVELNLNAGLQYDAAEKQLIIKDSEIKYDVLSASIHGAYELQKNRTLNLQVDASSTDLSFLSGIIRSEAIKTNSDLLKLGSIYLSGKIFGELSRQPVQFDLAFGMKNLALRLPDGLGTFRGLGFDGKFSSGDSADYSKARLEIKNLRGQLPGGYLNGQFVLMNFVNPYLSYNLNSRLKLDGYDKVFRIDFLRNLSGAISVQANFSGPLKLIAGHKMDNRRSSIITMNNLSFVIAKSNQLVAGLSAKIETRNNQTSIEQLTCTYGRNDLLINATIDNVFYMLFKNERDINTIGNIRSHQFYTKDFILDTLGNADVKDRISDLSFDFKITTPVKSETDTSSMRKTNFEIRNLAGKLDKLPDIKLINTSGWFCHTTDGLKLELDKFHATMPHGNVDVKGDLLIPKSELMRFNARIKLNNFPWTYIAELIAEIKSDKEPTAKKLPVAQMDIITADLDLSAEIITYPFDINNLKVRNSRASILFPDTSSISAEKINIALNNLRFNHPKNSGSITGLKSTEGTIVMKQLKIPEMTPCDIDMNVKGNDDILDLAFSRITTMTGGESGHFILDISKKEPEYQLNYSVRNADLASYVKKYYHRKIMSGKVDYFISIHATGSSWAKAKLNMTGVIEITSDSIQIYGIDVDDVLKKFEKSQNFTLTDLGAVIVAGPVGLAITKGSDFVSLSKVSFDTTSQTKIHMLVSRWKLENLQLITEDVAVITKLNRIALNGSVDFAHDSIPGLTVAVLDKNGCSLMDQKLFGKMGALQTGKLNVAKTIFGSVTNSFNAVVGKDCKPVYSGRVKNPVIDKEKK